MKNYPAHVKRSLNAVIKNMAKHPGKFCHRPGKDFTRARRLPFEKEKQGSPLSVGVFVPRIYPYQ